MPKWSPGDIALCIQSGNLTRSGTYYTVRDVLPKGHPHNADALTFLELHPDWDAAAHRFIKIDPSVLTDTQEHHECLT